MINKERAKYMPWGVNCESWIFCDNCQLSIKLEAIPPNSGEVKHVHLRKEQFFYILKGEAVFEVEGKKTCLKAGSGIHISKGLEHRLYTDQNGAVEFLVITTPNITGDRRDL